MDLVKPQCRSCLSRSPLLPVRLRPHRLGCAQAQRLGTQHLCGQLLRHSSHRAAGGLTTSASLQQATDTGSAALHHATNAMYSLAESTAVADAASAATSAAAAVSGAATDAVAQRYTGFASQISDALEVVLTYLQNNLEQLHVPYSYGWSIILLTLLVKTATFPLTKIQVESAMSIQELKPTIDDIKKRYGEDKKSVDRETSALYKKAGVNPYAGCLPSLATIPIFIGLYNSLTNVAGEGLLDAEGFYWLPSLAGPTTIAARRAGSGLEWLVPFQDGHPPIGWHDAGAYLLLPFLLVVAQYISSAIITPPVDPEDPNANTNRALFAFLPLMIGYFSLNVPAGLSLYYFANSVLTSSQQIWLRKLGGANINPFNMGGIGLGKARRSGEVAGAEAAEGGVASVSAQFGLDDVPGDEASTSLAASEDTSEADVASNGTVAASMGLPADPVERVINRRSKRKRRSLAQDAVTA
ncbi:hypothetical protein WJX72_008595 [[Myrmecia] bisecta]|uniref:Membrane insertase YidC/Oxa/ALB C-terminal domain-containing protein n=1 Tax=[Myrmecia] bisecta TaxID=41462 RepID=A0AAW1P3H4_9CHLO